MPELRSTPRQPASSTHRAAADTIAPQQTPSVGSAHVPGPYYRSLGSPRFTPRLPLAARCPPHPHTLLWVKQEPPRSLARTSRLLEALSMRGGGELQRTRIIGTDLGTHHATLAPGAPVSLPWHTFPGRPPVCLRRPSAPSRHRANHPLARGWAARGSSAGPLGSLTTRPATCTRLCA